MVNHLYWSASSRPSGGGAVVQGKCVVQSHPQYTQRPPLHFQSVNTLACVGMLKKSGLILVWLHVEV